MNSDEYSDDSRHSIYTLETVSSTVNTFGAELVWAVVKKLDTFEIFLERLRHPIPDEYGFNMAMAVSPCRDEEILGFSLENLRSEDPLVCTCGLQDWFDVYKDQIYYVLDYEQIAMSETETRLSRSAFAVVDTTITQGMVLNNLRELAMDPNNEVKMLMLTFTDRLD